MIQTLGDKISRWSRKACLPDDRTLEHDKHEQCEQTIIPILVQTPQGDTEDLKNKKRCSGLFSKEFRK